MADSRTLNTNMVTINGHSLPDPSEWQWNLSDISASDAGRDEGTRMHKMTLGQKRQYTLGWAMISPDDAAEILTAVNEAEEFPCVLWDAMDNEYEERTYYVGDRSAPMQQWMPNRKDGKLFNKISFTLIEV